METKEVFDKVASKYDIMNDIMSLGAHRYWKELLIDWLSPEKGMHITVSYTHLTLPTICSV